MEDLVQVAFLAELQNMVPVCLNYCGVPYCVVKAKGAVKAFIAICAHEDRPFPPRVQGECLVCPFHKVTFNAASGEVCETRGKHVPHGLLPVETEVRDGVVYLRSQVEHRVFLAENEERRRKRIVDEQSRSWLGFFRAKGK